MNMDTCSFLIYCEFLSNWNYKRLQLEYLIKEGLCVCLKIHPTLKSDTSVLSSFATTSGVRAFRLQNMKEHSLPTVDTATFGYVEHNLVHKNTQIQAQVLVNGNTKSHKNAVTCINTHTHRSWCVHCWKGLTYCTSRVTLSSHINYRNHTQTWEIFSCFPLSNWDKSLQEWAWCPMQLWVTALAKEEFEISLKYVSLKRYTTSVNFNSCAFCCCVFSPPSWHSAPVIQSSIWLSLLCLFFSWNAFTCPFGFLQL